MTKCEVESFPSIDLSFANPDLLKEIFLRLPKKDILECRQVCQKWKNIINERSFWLGKEEYERENYLKKLIDLKTPIFCDDFAVLSLKKPFNRNLLALSNPNGRFEAERHGDPRWRYSGNWGSRSGWKYASPPLFYSSQFHPEFEDLFDGCHETSYTWGTKSLDIHINEIGITSDVMDNHRPPIIFHEWIAHRADAGCQYKSSMKLLNKHGIEITSTEKTFVFQQWQLQKWEKVELIMISYPPGVRRIRVNSSGKDTQGWAGYYGCKIAGSHFEIKMEESLPYLTTAR